jgi:Protein of unknown function (DUF1638)
MLLKLISCNVFQREACLCLARSPHVIDVEFFELGEHAQPTRLNQTLQAKIDETENAAKTYAAILLLYGLCGNATIGLQTRQTRLVLPRAHDCCTILLGSKQRFQEHFQDNPSRPFSSVGYMERGNYFLRTGADCGQVHYGDQFAALVEQYGEENAKYIWDSLHPQELEQTNNEVVFIDLPETAALRSADRFREKAAQEGKTCVHMQGSLALIRKLLDGDWDPDEFLVVEPGQQTVGVYDWTEIIRAKPGEPSQQSYP